MRGAARLAAGEHAPPLEDEGFRPALPRLSRMADVLHELPMESPYDALGYCPRWQRRRTYPPRP